MRRVMQGAELQLAPEQVAEPQAAGGRRIFVRYENRIAGIIIVELIFLSAVIPAMLQIVGHGIVVDGDEEFRVHAVGARSALHQAPPGRRCGDQQHGLLEAGIDQGLLNLACELEVEGVFRDTRALIAPGTSTVWPTSTTARNEARAQPSEPVCVAYWRRCGARNSCSPAASSVMAITTPSFVAARHTPVMRPPILPQRPKINLPTPTG